MKPMDLVFFFLACALGVAGATPTAMAAFKAWTSAHPLLSAFVKFGLLATFGEALALRLKTGRYNRPGFGLATRALVWGVIGMVIAVAFAIFASGAGRVLALLGLAGAPGADGALTAQAVLWALTVSVTINCIFSPVFMTAHKLSDTHIAATGGSLRGFLTTRPDVAGYLAAIDWNIMWGFVFKKTIPFFWIPAHTITFLLPPHLRVLFAALLGVALGVILASALQKAPAPQQAPTGTAAESERRARAGSRGRVG
ncbi:MAG: Mpv17/PMP22 family protein [Desulfovibrionaceae bacterium]|jgi:hypothetical protein|nr:Mpv17/PMP22 family protein [Desulfovibrionaceae bacterium]